MITNAQKQILVKLRFGVEPGTDDTFDFGTYDNMGFMPYAFNFETEEKAWNFAICEEDVFVALCSKIAELSHQ